MREKEVAIKGNSLEIVIYIIQYNIKVNYFYTIYNIKYSKRLRKILNTLISKLIDVKAKELLKNLALFIIAY